MRPIALFLAVLTLAGCAGGPAYQEPLPRDTYQKVNVTSYVGAGGNGLTALGNRYRVGSVSSAAADWSRWPAGTQFRVLATGDIYEVDDYTDDIVEQNMLLLYKPSTPNSATRQVTIEIIRWGSPRDSAAVLRMQKSSTAKKILAELLARYPEKR